MKTINLRPTKIIFVALVTAALAPCAFAQGTVVPGDGLDQVSGDAPEASPMPTPRTIATETAETPKPAPAGPRPTASARNNAGASETGGLAGFASYGTPQPARPRQTLQGVLGSDAAGANPFATNGVAPVRPVAQTPYNSQQDTPAPTATTASLDAQPPFPDALRAPARTSSWPPYLTPRRPNMNDVAPLNDEEAAVQIEEADRILRVLKARDEATKVRLDLLKREAEIRKADLEAAPPAPAPRQQAFLPPPAPPAPKPVDKAAEKSSRDEREHGTVTQRFATVSIAGPEGRLVAVMRVKGFGDVQVKRGTSLPSGFKVANVEARGVSVKKDEGPAILVPFVAQ